MLLLLLLLLSAASYVVKRNEALDTGSETPIRILDAYFRFRYAKS